MKKHTPLYEVLWLSTLAPDAPTNFVADIASKTRAQNEGHGLTGLLIFNGLHLCQQVEGEKKTVEALVGQLLLDPRHVQMLTLHHGPLQERRFKCFGLGYTEVGDSDPLGRLLQLEGQAAMDAFIAILPTLDLNA
ncbi:BLUF domain-containing protein [Polaromonas sp.]|uniref:BLUF domain-containing protein n=1 Tax=Polaromonas sp. TaxID=1869339 RepID=UPI00286A53E5|nr:BLUF domain-containing protein [Polaromonas sp.]